MPVVFVVLAMLAVFVILAVSAIMLSGFIVSAVVGHVNFIVPPVAHEIDGPVAGVVLVAVLAPLFLVPGRHMQVDRLLDNVDGSRPYDERFGVNKFRLGRVPYVDAPVKPGLAHADGNANV